MCRAARAPLVREPRRRGLSARFGRGIDDLPDDVRGVFARALVRAIEREELLRALGSAVEGLLGEVGEVRELAAKVERDLRQLTVAWG